MYQGCEYAVVLNMSVFWIYHSFNYVRVAQGSKYAWIIPGYILLCLNVPKFVWMAFTLHSPIVIPYLNEPQTVFLESKNLIIPVAASWKYLILFFVFRLNIFASKVSNILLPFGAEEVVVFESQPNSEIPIHLWCFFMIYLSILLLFFHFLVLQRS